MRHVIKMYLYIRNAFMKDFRVERFRNQSWQQKFYELSRTMTIKHHRAPEYSWTLTASRGVRNAGKGEHILVDFCICKAATIPLPLVPWDAAEGLVDWIPDSCTWCGFLVPGGHKNFVFQGLRGVGHILICLLGSLRDKCRGWPLFNIQGNLWCHWMIAEIMEPWPYR